MYGVIKFQAPFERLKDYDYSAEVRLNKAILMQALIDASNTSREKEAKKLEIDAKKWIFGNSERFHEICNGANIEPSFMRTVTKEVIKLNLSKSNICPERKSNITLKKKDISTTKILEKFSA